MDLSKELKEKTDEIVKNGCLKLNKITKIIFSLLGSNRVTLPLRKMQFTF
jgi:hypothetical protein